MKIQNDTLEILQSHGVDTSNIRQSFKKLEVDDDLLATIIVELEDFFSFVFNDDELDEISTDTTIQEFINIITTKIADDYDV